ncbi:hypothetical protein C8J56DRAFT_777759 [Mycena floridula]|nr:hypothetical protein C8J56DRAFT_777759 [Mycena floridula]
MRPFCWTIGDLLFHLFSLHDEDGHPVSRSQSVGGMVQKYLSGQTTHFPGEILQSWLSCKDGQIDEFKDDDGFQMYDTMTPYTEIKPIRQCLTSFAAQICRDKLRREATKAVNIKTEILKQNQRLAFDFMSAIAGKGDPDENGVIAVRKKCPTDMVVIHALAALDFTRNCQAKRLPLARGLLYFASSAPVDLFAYESRIGTMPAYNTVYNSLNGLADCGAERIRDIGTDANKWGIVIIDNVQAYRKHRDMRIGNGPGMATGTVATFIEATSFDPEAASYDDKQHRIKENKRASLMVEALVGLIDQDHLETVGMLQWLQVLVNYLPQLAKHKPMVTLLYETRAVKQQIPLAASKIHLLASNGKNEVSTTELKDATLDFFEQIGQTRDKYVRRLQPWGGDGSTYQNWLNLKYYLQFHQNEFESFDLLEPVLQAWHTMWTDLCRIFETHWGPEGSKDPSTLGHSAGKIGRAKPANLKKVDYYPSLQLGYTVLDARMIDCCRAFLSVPDLIKHFQMLEATNKLPEFEDLEKMARKHYRAYSLSWSYYEALYGTSDEDSEWCKSVPRGSQWAGPTDDNLNDKETIPVPNVTAEALPKGKGHGKGKENSINEDSGATSVPKGKGKKKAAVPRDGPDFTGDRVLANSTALMHDMLNCREAAMAAASGDVGRFYEILKVMLFTFVGSAHTKYTNYLLETITNLELKSSPKLREALLGMMLVSLNGIDFIPGDLLQEHHNRLLEFMVERKGKEFSSHFIRHIISRNLHHFSRIKKELREGVGLGKRAAHHSDPHTQPEMKILLHQYALHELHSHRPGQTMEIPQEVDNFGKGLDKLYGGKLDKWVTETTAVRVLARPDRYQAPAPDNERDGEEAEETDTRPRFSLGTMRMVNGELEIETYDEETVKQVINSFYPLGDDEGNEPTAE